jgi:hypothetical protein
MQLIDSEEIADLFFVVKKKIGEKFLRLMLEGTPGRDHRLPTVSL